VLLSDCLTSQILASKPLWLIALFTVTHTSSCKPSGGANSAVSALLLDPLIPTLCFHRLLLRSVGATYATGTSVAVDVQQQQQPQQQQRYWRGGVPPWTQGGGRLTASRSLRTATTTPASTESSTRDDAEFTARHTEVAAVHARRSSYVPIKPVPGRPPPRGASLRQPHQLNAEGAHEH
jgi:hypothetical protein